MSNSLIVFLFLMIWIPFTLFYFRAEIKQTLRFGESTPRKKEESISIEDCLGASRQATVSRAAAADREPVRTAVQTQEKASDVSSEETSEADSPAPSPQEDGREEELMPVPPPYLSPSESIPMEVVDPEDEIAWEMQDMDSALVEERRLDEAERRLRQPYRSEEDDRQRAEMLYGLQDFEVFNKIRQDARLRTQEILEKYPPPPPAPLPEEDGAARPDDTEDGEEGTDTEEGAEDVVPAGEEEEAEGDEADGEEPAGSDALEDFLG